MPLSPYLSLGGAPSPLTTKGDIFTFNTEDARLPIGTDGQALIADSAESTGLRWGTVSGDNMATADLTLTADRTHSFNGNDLIFRTGASNRFRIWNGSGNIDNSLSFWDAGSGYMKTSFYTWTLSAGNATRDALRVHYNGVSSFGYNVRIGTNIVNVPSAKLHIHGNGATSATTTLLVENSTTTQLLKIDDDGGFALGLNASTYGYQSVTIGNGSSTTVNLSVAIGNSASSTSQGAIAIGHLALANGSSSSPSIAIGQESDASGFRSVALGWRSNASGSNSVAIGQNSSSTGAGVAISGTASGGYIAIKGTASSPNSIALGGTASQSSAVSIGVTSTSSGYGSVALGYGAVATGNNCYIIRSGTASTRTNSTSNSMEVHFAQSDATFRIGQSVDGWLNTSGNFAIGKTTGINEKLDVVGNIVSSGQIYSSQGSTINVTANSSTFDGNNGNSQPLDLASATADISLTFTNLKAGGTYFIPVTQKSSSPVNIGTYTISGGTVKFPSGTAPTISTGASEIDSLVCYYDGTDLLVNYSQNYS